MQFKGSLGIGINQINKNVEQLRGQGKSAHFRIILQAVREAVGSEETEFRKGRIRPLHVQSQQDCSYQDHPKIHLQVQDG